MNRHIAVPVLALCLATNLWGQGPSLPQRIDVPPLPDPQLDTPPTSGLSGPMLPVPKPTTAYEVRKPSLPPVREETPTPPEPAISTEDSQPTPAMQSEIPPVPQIEPIPQAAPSTTVPAPVVRPSHVSPPPQRDPRYYGATGTSYPVYEYPPQPQYVPSYPPAGVYVVPQYQHQPGWGVPLDGDGVNPAGAEGIYVGPSYSGGLHIRHPYYSYRRPWYTRGPASLNVDIVW